MGISSEILIPCLCGWMLCGGALPPAGFQFPKPGTGCDSEMNFVKSSGDKFFVFLGEKLAD